MEEAVVTRPAHEFPNPYASVPAEIVEIIEETPTIKTFRLVPERPVPFKTGQFVELSVPGLGEGPFTPSSSPSVTEEMEITIMRVGRVTEALHAMEPGKSVGVRGPYGVGYPLEKFRGKEVVIVGGGVGLAPLRSLLHALFEEIDNYPRVIVKYGARTPSDIVYGPSLPEWAKKERVEVELTVDEGAAAWKGKVGVVTTILNDLGVDLSSSVAVVCGPPVMMKFSTFKLLEVGFKPEDIYLSMEKNMSCGIGKCGHCRLGRYYACKDGPVFAYAQLEGIPDIWE